MELSNYTLVHLSFALSGKLINIFQRCSRTRRRPKCTFSFLFIEGLISFVASTVALNYLTLRYLSPYIWDWKKVLPNDPHWKGCQLQKAWMALRSNIWRLNVSKLAKVGEGRIFFHPLSILWVLAKTHLLVGVKSNVFLSACTARIGELNAFATTTTSQIPITARTLPCFL